MCKVSVVVPVYNAQEYIEKCLDSLIGQTYKNIEILCVDDCSNDGSLKILEQYSKKDERIIILNTQKNSGPAVARNLGVEKAGGKYIMFLDNDDSYQNSMCEKMVEIMESGSCDIAFCKTNIHIEEGACRDSGFIDYVNSSPVGRIKFTEEEKSKVSVLLWNKIFKADIVKNNGIRFPDGLDHEDDAFIFQYMTFVKNGFGTEEKLHNYYITRNAHSAQEHCEKITKENRKFHFDRIEALKYVYAFLNQRNLYKKQNIYYNAYEKNALSCLLGHCSKKDSKVALEIVKKAVKQNELPKSAPEFIVNYIENRMKRRKLKPLEYIFSLKNINKERKQLVVCGFVFKFKRRKTGGAR